MKKVAKHIFPAKELQIFVKKSYIFQQKPTPKPKPSQVDILEKSAKEPTLDRKRAHWSDFCRRVL